MLFQFPFLDGEEGDVVSEPVSTSKSAFYFLVLLLVIAAYVFFNSPLFETDHLEWTGLVFLDEEELDAFVDFSPINVLRLDTSNLAKHIKKHPWVDEVKIRWRWPNRVQVTVLERKPLAMIPIMGGWFLLDPEGNLLPPPRGIAIYTLPLVTDIDIDSAEQLKTTARLLRSIPSWLEDYVSEWNVKTASFVSREGTQIVIGDQTDLDEKFALLKLILEDLTVQGVTPVRIDLRIPKSPVVTTR